MELINLVANVKKKVRSLAFLNGFRSQIHYNRGYFLMKKLFSGIIIFTLALLSLPVLASGSAQLTFEQTEVEVAALETFDMQVNLQPQGEEIDTVRMILTFNPLVLRAESVVLNGAFNRTAPGNYRDNKSGEVSWGAFTLDGSVLEDVAFANVTFRALQSGDATISLSLDSRIISQGEEKIDLTNLASTQVTVGEKTSESATELLVSSASHPNSTQWYAQNTVELEWVSSIDENEINEYLVAFDQASDSKPSESQKENNVQFEGVSDGIHYLHVQGMLSDGSTTDVVHRRINVDTTPPNAFELTVEQDQIIEGESLWLTFATTDEFSGVIQYQVAVNDGGFELASSPLEIKDLEPGTYFYRISALDRAGNAIYQGKSVRVYPEGTEIDRPIVFGDENTSEARVISDFLEFVTPQADGSQNRPIILYILLGILSLGIVLVFIRHKK